MHDQTENLLRLAENRRRRMLSGRPVYKLTIEERERSSYWAMRVALASKSQVAERDDCAAPVAA
jgi:hypothetical protein